MVTTTKVACDGGGGALGHPKVWYDMSEEDHVECKYCDRIFVLKGGSHDQADRRRSTRAELYRSLSVTDDVTPSIWGLLR